MKNTIDRKKRFEHDCDTCIFLGHTLDADLYAHLSKDDDTLTTVIARMSSDPSDYTSGISNVMHDARLAAAFGMASAPEIGFA